MRRAGIREVRQNLSRLLDEVRRGREIVITDRGTPVARLVPPARNEGKPYRDHAAFRRTMPRLDPPLSVSIGDERDDRI